MLRPYSIGMAARLAGVEAETLRMWERRYGFTDPERTAGGHRLYSDEDVELLRAVRKLVDGGARVGALAALDRQALLELASAGAPGGAPAQLKERARDPYDALVDDVIDAALSFDTQRAAALLDRPRLNLDGRDVVRLVYLPVLRRAGDLWREGGLSVAVEHFVEKLVSARMHGVLAATPEGRSGRIAVCACPPGERHEGGLIAAAIELRFAGYRVTLLGADTPVDDLVDAVHATNASLIVLAVTMRVDAKSHRGRALVRALDGALRDVPLIVGGAGADELAGSLKRDVVLSPSVDALGAMAPRAARRALTADG